MYAYDFLQHHTLFVYAQRSMRCLHKTKYELQLSNAIHFRIFGFSQNGQINTCSPFVDISAYKIPWPHVGCFKFLIHLRCSNIRHFRVVEARYLNLCLRGHLFTEFKKSLLISSKVTVRDTPTDGQTEFSCHKPFFLFQGTWIRIWP
jgi:hypothetical protein